MKNESKLDELFNQLRNQPSELSFEEVHDSFVKSLEGKAENNHVAVKSTHYKTYIMLFTALGILIGGLLLFMQPESKSNSFDNEVLEQVHDSLSPESISENVPLPVSLPEFPKNAIPVYESRIENNQSFVLPVISLDTHETIYQKVGQNKFLNETERLSEFPVLTEEEVELNSRNKSDILRKLEKRDKRNYVYIDARKDSILMSEYYIGAKEVTNLEYRTFLFDLLIQGRKDEYRKAEPKQSNWTEFFGESNESMEHLYFTHEAYDLYPVVNVSREGAELYCQWLFEELMKDAKLKQKSCFHRMRLPLRGEWLFAASSGGRSLVYPWPGNDTKNSAGCYLANYKPLADNYHVDGGFYTVRTDSYLPNEFGLYNTAGNVAEMVYESSATKEAGTAGGGWMSEENELQLNGLDPYAGLIGAHPNIGFRIVFNYSE